MRYDFEATGPLTVAAKTRSSDLTLSTGESNAVVVTIEPRRGGEDLVTATRVEMIGDRLVIEVPKQVGSMFGRSGSVAIEVAVPMGTALDADSGSGDVRAHGSLSRVDIQNGSGDVSLDRAEDGKIATGSGDVVVTESGQLRLTSGSGDVRIDQAERLEIRTGSGDVAIQNCAYLNVVTGSGDAIIGSAGGQLSMSTGSGDLIVRRISEGEVQAKTASGDVIVGVAQGSAALLDCSTVSGRVSSDLDGGSAPGDDERGVVLRLRSVSGDVRIQRA